MLTLLNCVTVGRWCKWSLTEIVELKCPPAASGNWKFIGAVRVNHNSFRQSNKENNGPNYKLQPNLRAEATKKCRFTTHMVTIITLLCLLTAAVTFPNTSSIIELARVLARLSLRFAVCSETVAQNHS